MTQPLSIAFMWHMHQPYYRNLATGECSMPWVRLHATKDYLDMVKRLEAFPTIHQTFNLVPSLLDQLEEYGVSPQASEVKSSDTFLLHALKPAAELSEDEQRFLLRWFFLAHMERMIQPYPRYHDLLVKRGLQVKEADWPEIQRRFSIQDYLDLQVWFNLTWIDPWLRRQDPRLRPLETKGGYFTEAEKRVVLGIHREILAGIIPAYRAAADRGQIELTTSPYYHPILPLLCNLRAAHMALPHLPLPETSFRHPEDARWHLQRAVARHQAAFGRPAHGLWPSEGSVSEDVVSLAMESQLRWIATDEEILWRTINSPRSAASLHRPHRLQRKEGELAVVFRDRELSDLIGFVYSQWEPDMAVADFMGRLGQLHRQSESASQPALVSIILDGENAWEAYADDGHPFLTQLYEALANDARFRCVTISEFLDAYPVNQAASLPPLWSGSWIDANFATWVGHPEKNAAWSHLAHARSALGSFSGEASSMEAVRTHLGIAEGSDWMWWFGDTHFSLQAEEFDRLFRTHLANCYAAMTLPVPEALQHPIRQQPLVMWSRPTGCIHPTIDGVETSYYEWLYAGRVDLLPQSSTAAQRSTVYLRTLYYGFDEAAYYFRLDLDGALLRRLAAWQIELALVPPVRLRIALSPPAPVGVLSERAIRQSGWNLQASLFGVPPVDIRCALTRILEIAIPLHAMGLRDKKSVPCIVTLTEAGRLLERHPVQGMFELTAPSVEFEAQGWPV